MMAVLWLVKMKKIICSLLLTLSFVSLMANANTFKLDRNRVVLEQDVRRGEVRIYNTSDVVQSFKVTLIDMIMTPEGGLRVVDDYDYSAKQFLRVGPRVAKDVLPNQYQKIRLVKKNSIPEGEFRAHLLVESLSKTPIDEQGAVVVTANFKIVIPIFVKNTNEVTHMQVGDVSYHLPESDMSVYLNRLGKGHTSGNLVVRDKQEKELYRINQISLYPELKSREVLVPIKFASVKNKSLKIQVEDVESKEVLSEKVIHL